MRLWENWPCMGFLLIISITIVGIILGIEKSQPDTNVTRHGRSTSQTIDPCTKGWFGNGIELTYINGSSSSFIFDLCEVINCQGQNNSWRGYDVYLCDDHNINLACRKGSVHSEPGCPAWTKVRKYTGLWAPEVQPNYGSRVGLGWKDKVSFQRDYSTTQNPLTLSIGSIEQAQELFPGTSSQDKQSVYITLGVDQTGKDSMGLIKINIVPKPKPQSNITEIKNVSVISRIDKHVGVDYTKLTPEDIIEKATGYGETNLWLEWLINTAKEQKIDDCVACAGARPRLHIEPAPLHPNDTWGYNCMLSLTREVGSTNCTTLASLFPPISNDSITGPFVPRQNNYTCFNFTPSSASINYGRINEEWCNVIIKDNGTIIGPWARAGLYYYCGDRRLFTRVPPNTKGLCAMVRLGAPLTLIGERVVEMNKGTTGQLTHRRRRHVIRKRGATIDLSLNSPTYIDIIGVPRGVPEEYKLADQIAAGFENIPLIAALFPITPNKNVDRINYVHYNVMRLANLSRDAVKGLSEQLAPTSLMAVQNRLSLDMLLAEKGGVCHMFGDLCCTFIPNNTAPDGSVTKALEGLRVLSIEMKEHSGVDNPVEQWLDGVLGKWKALILSILVSIAVFIAILVACGCCCIPCIRSLCNRLIVAAIEKKDMTPPPYSMPLLSTYQDPESEDDDDEEHQV